MQGWIVALIEKDSGVMRTAQADANGALAFKKVSLDAAHTVVLFSPDFIVQSVLSMASNKERTVRQFFRLTQNTMPRLVQKGGIVNFQTLDTVSILDYYATDTNNDFMPDGVSTFGFVGDLNLINSSPSARLADSDVDGIDNLIDIDIDGDGIPNAFDSDDDGDGISDVLDIDANGDSTNDSLQQTSDLHFKPGLEYIAVQNITTPTSQYLRFIAKAREGVTPRELKISTSKTLTDGSIFTRSDSSTGTWDLTLSDDGVNDDGSATDRIYARSVTLASGQAVRANQVFVFQLTIGEGAEQFTAEYPYTVPNLSVAVPTTTYTAGTRTVTLSGDPFGASVQDFVWSVSVLNSSGVKVFESNSVAGSTRTSVIPTNILVSGQTYTYRASAQLLEKVSGYPGMVVYSAYDTISP
jgi:hypothetical protein